VVPAKNVEKAGVKILISGYYGFGNIGDEAILEALVKGFRERHSSVEITVLSATPAETAALSKIKAIHRYDFLKIWREINACAVLVSGGGTLFQDATSSRSCWYYLAIIWLAKLRGKKVMLFAQGIGPMRQSLNRFLARRVLNRVDLITLRDTDSFEALKQLGVNRPRIKVTADPTFILEGQSKSGALDSFSSGKPLLAVVLRRFPPVPDREKHFSHLLAAELDRLKAKYGWEVIFLSFQSPADVSQSTEVVNLMREKPRVFFKTCPGSEMLSLFPRFEFVISMRLHALIFAALHNVPMLGIAYDPKVKSFTSRVNQPCLDLDQVYKIGEVLDQAISHRLALKTQLAEVREQLLKQAQENFDLFFEVME
jgi:polysaccharide pyruvyl transferase CsaB